MDNQQPILIHIETATEVCSVALTKGDKILNVCESSDGNSHSRNLLPFIDKALNEAHLSPNDLQGVVVSIGPGSYTGLRIGVSTVKGIAYSLKIPVITVGTLEGIAYGCQEQLTDPQGVIVPMIDARRMEVFSAIYDSQMVLREDVAPVIVENGTYATWLERGPVYFCGNGMPKCRETLRAHPNARFVESPISARHLLKPALAKWHAKDFADTAYFEPFYLKEYVAAKPNVKGLH